MWAVLVNGKGKAELQRGSVEVGPGFLQRTDAHHVDTYHPLRPFNIIHSARFITLHRYNVANVHHQIVNHGQKKYRER